MASRKESVKKRIEELDHLLDQWEDYQITARDPNEVLRCHKEIDRIQSYLKQYNKELAGHGKQVEEDKENPILAPAIRQNNRRWMFGIFFSLLFLTTGYYTYESVTKEQPNYEEYLEYLEMGNKLIKENKFQEAKTAFEKALAYYPNDSTVVKKINLLREANQVVKTKNYQEADKIFKLILNIPPASEASFNASYSNTTKEDKSSNQMQVIMEWAGSDLILTISGGVPFDNLNAPYDLDGLKCMDCVRWEKEGSNYKAIINGSGIENFNLTINISDRIGNQSTSGIPSRPVSLLDTALDNKKEPNNEPVVEDPQKKEKQFESLVDIGDNYFKQTKYIEAKKEYQKALQIKSADAYVKNKINECEEKLAAFELKEARAIANIPIKGGEFNMGFKDGFPEERPVHKVTLGSFKISKYEVTVKQFRKFCEYTNRQMPPSPAYGWKDSYPITNVTWEEANAFCQWVGGRLPTEAEWEYAARDGGGMATYSGGNQLNNLAIYDDNSGGHPSQVGSKRANSFKLYDMTGNVSEWCADWYGKYPEDIVQNPKGLGSGKYKVLRGGAYNSTPVSTQDGDQLRVTYRNYKLPNVREPYLGFRVAW